MNFKNNELLMLGGAFILGVFVDRYMNHRDIVTGEVKEGVDTKVGTDPKKGTDPKVGTDPKKGSDMWAWVIVILCIGVVCILGGTVAFNLFKKSNNRIVVTASTDSHNPNS